MHNMTLSVDFTPLKYALKKTFPHSFHFVFRSVDYASTSGVELKRALIGPHFFMSINFDIASICASSMVE